MINAQLRDAHPEYEVHRGTYQQMMNYALTATEGMPRSPVVALVASGDHWSVVQGFSSGTEGTMVYFRDPTPVLDGRIAHAAGDVCVGQDADLSGLEGGEATPCDKWKASNFLASRHAPETKFVMLGPSAAKLDSLKFRCQVARADRRPRGDQHRDAGGLIDGALEQFATFGMLAVGEWGQVRRKSDEIMRRSARTVESMDGSLSYALAPLFIQARRVGALAVDNASGDLLRTRLGLPERQMRYLFDGGPLVPESHMRIKHRLIFGQFKETFFSPFFPLVEFSGGDHRFYRGFDDRFFDTLTPASR